MYIYLCLRLLSFLFVAKHYVCMYVCIYVCMNVCMYVVQGLSGSSGKLGAVDDPGREALLLLRRQGEVPIHDGSPYIHRCRYRAPYKSIKYMQYMRLYIYTYTHTYIQSGNARWEEFYGEKAESTFNTACYVKA